MIVDPAGPPILMRTLNPLPARLLAVTDRHQAEAPLVDVVARLLDAGARWLWLRDRDLAADEREALAGRLLDLTRAVGATLTVGADIGLAATLGAPGVQVGLADAATARRRLGPTAVVGVSAHALVDIAAARQAGADYATLSPIFASPSKPGYGPALGLAALREASRIGLPVLALGGVTASNAGSCLEAGAAGVAVMGPLMRQAPPGPVDLIALSRRS